MKLNVLKCHDDIEHVEMAGDLVIEFINPTSEYNDSFLVRYFNPKNNLTDVIAPALKKTTYVKIQNAIWNSKDYYFPVISENKDKTAIDIYKFSSSTKTYDIFYSFSFNGLLDERNNQIRVFVLSDTSLLIQTEVTDKTRRDDIMGHIIFEQKIVDVESFDVIDIKDENIKNNGIALIKAVSPTQIMIKTGFSYLEDSRLKPGKEYDALIESIFIHTTSKFIADLSIRSETIDAKLITSAYFDKYLISTGFKDEFIFFNIYDPKSDEAEIVFYNINSSERFNCKSEEFDINDPDVAYVINNIPYVKNTALSEIFFLNLKTMEFDLSTMDMDFIDIIGNLILLKRRKKNGNSKIVFYHYPDMRQIDEENGSLAQGCYLEDEYFIYVQE